MDKIMSVIMALITMLMSLMASLLGGTTDPVEADMTWPVKNESYILSKDSEHIDIALTSGNTEGEPFYAVKAGTVVEVRNDGQVNRGYGNYVILKHENDVYTVYGYASNILVNEGVSVTKGQQIGTIGKTGNATAACLHFEIMTTDSAGYLIKQNPLNYVENPYKTTTPSTSETTSSTTSSTSSATSATTSSNPSSYVDSDGKFIGTFTFTTYGWGHGVGMSQQGAIVMAKGGKSYSDIISHYYPGTSLSTDSSTPSKVTKNGSEITLLEFLCKTVAQEIGDDAPYEALKAQAVVSYTYSKSFGYGSGQAYRSSFSYSGTNVEKAVMSVLGMSSASDTPKAKYVTYNGKTAKTYYFDSSAGKTTSAGNAWGGTYDSYLNGGVESPETVTPYTKTFTAQEVYELIDAYAKSKNVSIKIDANPANWFKILTHDAAYSKDIGYVITMTVGNYQMNGNTFRENLMSMKIRSQCFTVTYSAT